MICKLCLFYKTGVGADSQRLHGGECRRHPPTIHVWTHEANYGNGEEIRSSTDWPQVLETEWCGEFKQRVP